LREGEESLRVVDAVLCDDVHLSLLPSVRSI
jgi:hypothetical protein